MPTLMLRKIFLSLHWDHPPPKITSSTIDMKLKFYTISSPINDDNMQKIRENTDLSDFDGTML